jgi:hypothetical protein
MPPNPPKREGAAAVAGRLAPCAALGAPGWVIERSIGAALGAVFVEGAELKVRLPRLPALLPPPTRASAKSTMSTDVAASASVSVLRRENRMKALSLRNRYVERDLYMGMPDSIVTDYCSQDED